MKAAHPEVVAATRVNPGETLRQARESNGWSLAQVALKLNLTVASLSNLEAGAFDKLPGHTFARGYIRAYAKLLDMDQTVLVQQFDQYTGSDAQGSNVHSLGRIEEPVRVSHTILRIVSLLLLIAVIGGGFVWWQDQTSLRSKESVAMAPEHVEVEGADGTTRIHPLDEPEDQAVLEGQAEGETNLALPQGQEGTDAEAGAEPSTPAAPTVAPAVPSTHTPTAGAPVAPSTPAPTVAAPAAPVAPASAATPVTLWRRPQVKARCRFSSLRTAGPRLPTAMARCCSAASSARAIPPPSTASRRLPYAWATPVARRSATTASRSMWLRSPVARLLA